LSVLDEVLAEAARAGRSGVVVFDLDSTLLDNRPRQARILREFGAAKNLAPLVGTQPSHWTSWSIEEAMRATGLSDEETRNHAFEARRFWRERFFTSEYCAMDEAIAGAVAFVGRVRQSAAVVAYCTGRHEAMREGTLVSFRRLGFPLPGDGVELLMKPRQEIHDDDFKVTACERLRELGRVLAAFDNEPTHINIYRAAFPEARALHLATDHSGRPVALLDGVVSIRGFV
jgi:predicted secreted acid phosphatase